MPLLQRTRAIRLQDRVDHRKQGPSFGFVTGLVRV
jgi:hypothetical protein